MLNWLKERQTRARTARKLYGSIVTQARQPGFYADLAFPDTALGRFELIALHTALVMRRLQRAGEPSAALARLLAEAFVADMDDNMRELTFSDLAVPREVKRVAAALYDRHGTLTAGLDAAASLEVLDQALARDLAYIVDGGMPPVRTVELAGYLRAAATSLDAQPLETLCAEGPAWLSPAHTKGASR